MATPSQSETNGTSRAASRQYSGTLISDLQDTVERVAPNLCGHCFGQGEAAKEQGWPTFDYKMVPCPYCPAGEKLSQELAEVQAFKAWKGLVIGITLSIPFWVLLAHEVQKGLWR